MTTTDLFASLSTLLHELTHGAAPTGGFVLNRGDAGLLASLQALTAADASASAHGGATIAAHVAHVSYGLSLMNRWAAGENPFETADWSAAWRIGAVAEAEWTRLREELRTEADRQLSALKTPRELSPIELNGVIAEVAHVAYHMGAIRQIHASARGPKHDSAAT
ncbi:MAG TPA: hypothetical protein VMF13_04640 [Luteitalea sp.]|nr:hypothetical protein [Luteitalea sp.]